MTVVGDLGRSCVVHVGDGRVPGGVGGLLPQRRAIEAMEMREAVNEIRNSEQRVLLAEGDGRLKRTRFLWLMGPQRRARLAAERRGQCDALRVPWKWRFRGLSR